MEIKLPSAIEAKAIEATEPYVYYLNINEKGHVIFPAGGRPVLGGKEVETSENPEQLRIVLKRRADEDRDAAAREAAKNGLPAPKPDEPLRTLIVLRVHKDCQFEKTYGFMKACRAAGYSRIQLRAILGGSAEAN